MDSPMTDRPQAHWVEVPSPAGGTHLEMRWTSSTTLSAAHAA